MKIAFQTNNSPYGVESRGGAETSLRLLAEKFANKGHQVIFINKSTKRKLIPIKIQFSNGVKLYQLYDVYIPSFGVRLIRNKVILFNDYLYILILKFILIKNKIQIVHTFYELNLCLLYLKLRDKYKIPFKFIIRIAGMSCYEEIIKYPYLKEQYQYAFNNADSLNFISKGLLKLFFERNDEICFKILPQNKLVLDIGINIADVENISDKMPYKLEQNFKMIMAARFVDVKRQDIILESLKFLDNRIPYTFYFYGSGPNREELVARAEKLKLGNHIKFIPFISQSELWEIMRNSDLLCHACDYEGLCKIIIESMNLGLPVLASNVIAPNTYIIDGENGFLVANSPEEWAKKIETIYKNRESLSKIAKNAQTFITTFYDSDKNILKYIEHFESL